MRFAKLTGIAPDRLLLCKYKSDKSPKLPNSDGLAPVNELPDAASRHKFTRLPNSDGIVPPNVLLCKSNLSKFTRLPNCDGIPPVKDGFASSLNSVKFVIVLTDVGIVPVKLFPPRSKAVTTLLATVTPYQSLAGSVVQLVSFVQPVPPLFS